MEDIIKVIIFLLVGSILMGLLIWFCIDDYEKYTYRCTDYKGDIIYCKQVTSIKGEMRGTMEDGTVVEITSYKKVLEEENDKR